MSLANGSTSDTNNARLEPAQIPAQIDLLIALHLNLWPALSVAIQNGWGTSSPQIGADKRDWLAGAISDLFEQKQLRDIEDLEDVLEQVMSDEFEVVIDDGSLEEVARLIWKGRERLLTGDGSEVKELMARWETKRAKGGDKVVAIHQQAAGEDDDDDDDDDSEDGGVAWNGFEDNTAEDVDMDEAPALVSASASSKKKPEPQIDEDGFTTVMSKKKR